MSGGKCAISLLSWHVLFDLDVHTKAATVVAARYFHDPSHEYVTVLIHVGRKLFCKVTRQVTELFAQLRVIRIVAAYDPTHLDGIAIMISEKGYDFP